MTSGRAAALALLLPIYAAGGAELHEAAHGGRSGEVLRLIASGADLNQTDRYGFTPLLLAEIGGHQQTAELLRARNAERGLPALLLRLEAWLGFLGYQPGAVDGRAEAATRTAIQAFQRDEQLPVDGRLQVSWVRRLHRKLIFQLQTTLLAKGWYAGVPHGILDDATRASIKTAAAEFGLPSNGEPSAPLLAKLGTPLASTPILKKTAAGAAANAGAEPAAAPPQLLRHIQARLQTLGYAPGKIDGKLGRQTRSAIRRFQTRSGTPVTGAPSAALLARLNAKNAPTATAQTPAGSGDNSEISGPLRFEHAADGTLLGCAIGALQIDRPWCLPFTDSPQGKTERCKAIVRPDSTVLLVRCR